MPFSSVDDDKKEEKPKKIVKKEEKKEEYKGDPHNINIETREEYDERGLEQRVKSIENSLLDINLKIEAIFSSDKKAKKMYEKIKKS